MTQEEKLLLTKDLCARLPYGVKCYVPVENCTMELTGKRLNYFCFHKDVWGIDYSHELEIVIDPLNDANNGYIVKPYLRPMSSMTEEEFVYFMGLRGRILQSYEIQSMMKEAFNMPQSIGIVTTLGSYSNKIDWLNKHHFDYRGLIPKGLAIEAPEGMY